MDKIRAYKELLKRLENERSNQLYKINRKRQEQHYYDPKKYEEERKLINATINEEKSRVLEEMNTYKGALRKGLALALNSPRDSSPESETLWRKAIEKVQNATSPEDIRELTRQATIWKDRDLARALVFSKAGTRDYEYIHHSLQDQDEVIKALYEFEREFGDYRTPEKLNEDRYDSMLGWVSPDQVVGADGVPGRIKSIKPPKKPLNREEQ